MHPDDLRQACSDIIRDLTPLLVEAEANEARHEALRTALIGVVARWPQLRRTPDNTDANRLHAALQGLPGPAYNVDPEAIREVLDAIEDIAAETQAAADRADRERLADVEQQARELRERLGTSQAELPSAIRE